MSRSFCLLFFQCLEPTIDTRYILAELIHELVNVGTRYNFVGWNGEARHLGIPSDGIKEISNSLSSRSNR